MATGKNSYTLNVDIKQRMSNKTPRFVQYDSAQIIFKIYDSGKQYDLSPFTSAIVTHKLPNGKTIAGYAEFTELNGQRVVVYDYMGSEMEQEGNIETSVGLFVGDTQKVSIMPFNVEIVDDLGNHIDEDVEAKYSVLQVMIGEVTELNATMTANENTRQSNEATRRSQEIQRQTNEDTRKSNENTRISNENTRKTNEDTRQSNETTRESNEATRKTDESGRVSAENTRKSNETTRQNQESGRVSAESTRVTTENARISAEDTRKSNETARQSAETARSNAEKTRGTNEDTRKANETTRLSNEDERKTAESRRKSAETTRESNETSRVSAEDTRKANETERQKQEGIRNTAETERLSNENARVSAERTRENQESTRQTQESTRQTNTNNAIARLDTAVNSTKLEFKAPVETKAALSTTYSNAQVGWVAQVTTGEDAGKFFRYNGSTWEFQSEIALDAVTDIQNKLHRTDRKTQTLIDGVNIVDAPVASPTDIEIQGRTMVSLGNSNLEKNKYYAVTDEKYKVITDGKTVSGVGKFQKGETHKTVADFKGKKSGSVTENPHIFKRDGGSAVLTPEGFRYEALDNNLTRISSLDGNSDSVVRGTSTVTEPIPQHLFSFNVIEQVERTLGIIPGGTVAEKVAWLRSNGDRFYFYWHGYGSGPLGNKANVSYWQANNASWSSPLSHENSTVERRERTLPNLENVLESDGFVHFLAYAEPSDGTTPSTIYTDYVQLEINLKPTAQLNTRPTIVRVENFEGKVAGSTVENPHRAMGATTSGILLNPDEFSYEMSDIQLGRIVELDGRTHVFSTSSEGRRAQTLFSFNIIEAVERNIGRIPVEDTAGKVNWLRENVRRIRSYWWGYGRGPSGNKATYSVYYDGGWGKYPTSHTFDKPSVQSTGALGRYDIGRTIQDNGYVYFLAYAEASDGNVVSSITTQYVDLEVHIKPTADFRQPRVPLYEVPKAEYDRIGVSQTDEETKRRYPAVRGVQHLVNPYVVNPGENLIPPFTDETQDAFGYKRWHYSASLNASEISPNSFKVTNPGSGYSASTVIPVVPGVPITVTAKVDATTGGPLDGIQFDYYESDDARKYDSVTILTRGHRIHEGRTFTPQKNFVRFRVATLATSGGHTYTIENLMLTPGTEPKPFTPYNPSTLHAPVTLSAVGDKRDVLYQQDGRWYVRRTVREVEFTGDYGWKSHPNNDAYSGFKWIQIPKADTEFGYLTYAAGYAYQAYSYKGHKLQNVLTSYNASGADEFHTSTAAGSTFRITVADKDTGFPSSYIPSDNEVKMYLNGWRYTDGTTWESVTGNGQTATAEESLSTMPTDYTPYKLTYVLATPEVIDVTELVEGDIAVSGMTQIEVGAGEIVTEDEDGNRTYTRIPDNEKHNVTAAPDNVKITYEQNIRSAHEALVNDVVQNTSLLSIHERAIVNLFARIRGLELSADEIRQDLDDLRTDFDNLPEPTPPTDGGTA